MEQKEAKKSIDFINEPQVLTQLSMNDIIGGQAVQSYVDCGQVHHNPDAIKASTLNVW